MVDNLEHLDGVGGVLTDLLRRVPQVTALVTSRAPIGLPDEQAWPVRPLAVPAGDAGGVEELRSVSSVELLVDRVRRATPAFELTGDAAAVVAEVCRRLDGLPLALELAAGSWRVLGARGVLDAVSADPLDVHDLQGARPAVHSSLRSASAPAMACSPTRHGTSFTTCRCSVAAGRSMRQPKWSAGDRCSTTSTGWRRWAWWKPTTTQPADVSSMLPTIQAFAASYAFEAGITDNTAVRHADYFRRWVADLKSELDAASKVALQRLHADGDNLRAALEWFARHDAAAGLAFAIDLHRYWEFRGSIDEGLGWFETLLQRAGAVEQAALAQLLGAFLACYGGHPTASRRFAEQSIEEFRRRGDAHGVALATGVLGDLEMRRALEESVRINREAALALESHGDFPNLCWVLSNLALGLTQLGDFAEAERTVRREIADARQHGVPYLLAAGSRVLAGILRLRGDLAAADRLLAESDSLMAGLGDLRFGATWFAEWAVVAAGLGDIERASDLAALALANATESADSTAMGWALWAEGEVRLTGGEQAAGSFARALRNMRRYSLPLRRLEALTGLALAVDDAEIAAAATAAAVALRDDQHMVLPGVAARLDEVSQRWAAVVGADRWAQWVGHSSTRSPMSFWISSFVTSQPELLETVHPTEGGPGLAEPSCLQVAGVMPGLLARRVESCREETSLASARSKACSNLRIETAPTAARGLGRAATCSVTLLGYHRRGGGDDRDRRVLATSVESDSHVLRVRGPPVRRHAAGGMGSWAVHGDGVVAFALRAHTTEEGIG